MSTAGIDYERELNPDQLAAATAQLGRAERLWAARAIPERQLDDARTQVALARAKVAAVRGRLAQYDASAGGRGAAGRIALRAPRAGRIADLAAISGAAVDAGAPLVTIVDGERLWLHADVYEPDVAAAAAATGASFTVDGVAAPIAIAPPDGRLVSVGAAVDLAVPRSPRINTPPICGLIAFRIKARFMRSCPTIAVKGKIGGINVTPKRDYNACLKNSQTCV